MRIDQIEKLLTDLFPTCRSITGNGVRDTLNYLRKSVDFQIHEIPSGTSCFDWTVPPEWNVHEAFIEDASGKRLVDFKSNNLHIVSYSAPVDGTFSYEEIIPHIHTLPELPEAIPYRTSYYKQQWGFCVSHQSFSQWKKNDRFRVVIRSDLNPKGSLTLGEAFLPGESSREFLFTTYCCHPSMANDNLSGVITWTLLLKKLSQMPRKYSYRFAIFPETIGALAFLKTFQGSLENIMGGYVITNVGGPGPIGYKKTYLENHFVDRIAKRALNKLHPQFTSYPFDAAGSDERQFSSPGFHIPMGSVTKDKYYEYLYYHTSLDNLDFVKPQNINTSFKTYEKIIQEIESSVFYKNLSPFGEPMLSKRGLYPTLSGHVNQKAAQDHISKQIDAINWLMFLGDGHHTLTDVSEKTGLPMEFVEEVFDLLQKNTLLKKVL